MVALIMDSKQYLTLLEQKVLIPCYRDGKIARKNLVSGRLGKFYSTPYGRWVGFLLDCDDVVVLDYYGLHKKSHGFVRELSIIRTKLGKRDVAIRVPVLSFASVHLEDVMYYAPELVGRFPSFKMDLIRLRGFKVKT